jgi:methyl-accepting chemotaxis protein
MGATMRVGLLGKMVLSTGAIASALLIANAWLAVTTTRRLLFDGLLARAEAQASRLATPIEQGFLHPALGLDTAASFWSDARQIVEGSRGVIHSAAFIDQKGLLRIHNDRARIGSPEPDAAVLAALPRLDKAPVILEATTTRELIVLVPVRDPSGQLAGAVRLGVPQTLLVAARKRILLQQGGLLVVSLLVTFVASALLVARAVVRPLGAIGEATGAIASGRLAERVPTRGDGEIDALGRRFNQMADQLHSVLAQVRETARSVASAAAAVAGTQGAVLEGTEAQQASLDRTAAGITALDRATATTVEHVQRLLASAQSVSSTGLELSATAGEVSARVDELVQAVEGTTAGIAQIAASLKEVADTVDQLARSTETVASTVIQMDASVMEIDQLATGTAQLSTQLARDAEGGRQAVDAAIAGMDEIRTASQATAEVLRGFEATAAQIGKILQIIDDVADETNLLALNAAILAAQAGEHGRGFAVVAEDIKALAERTAVSTRDIAALIDKVQGGSRAAVEATARGERAIIAGVDRSRRAGTALGDIFQGIQRAQEMVARIARATQAHTAGSRQVTASVREIAEMTRQVRVTAEAQVHSGGDVARAAAAMAEASRLVRRAAHEQRDASQAMGAGMAGVVESVRVITEASQRQKRESEAIVSAMGTVRQIAGTTTATAADMGRVVESLGAEARALEAALGRFALSS